MIEREWINIFLAKSINRGGQEPFKRKRTKSPRGKIY